MSETKNYVTEEGLKKLQERYDYLVHERREQVKHELAEARSLGDLSENADYDAARDEQAKVEAEILELEAKLNNYEIYPTDVSSHTVGIGSTVTIRFSDSNTEETYTIVGTTEADPLNGKISNESPLAAALLNHNAKVGSTVTVNVKNPYQVTVVAIG